MKVTPDSHGFGLDRRSALAALAGLAALAPAAASAQLAAAAPADVKELMAPGALPDIVIGDANAPVTIVEYASMTCTHCAEFAVKNWPEIRKRYVDTGKAKLILREFPLDALAAAAFMLARCSGDKREAVVDLLFRQQTNWAFVDKPLDALQTTIRQTGMTDAAFKACLDDKQMYQNVVATMQRGQEKFGVNSTPTFFINGQRLVGDLDVSKFAEAIDAAAAKAAAPAATAPAAPAPAEPEKK